MLNINQRTEMFFIKHIIILFSLLVTSISVIDAKSYERWHLLYPDTYGVIKKIKDTKKNKTVIEFNSKSSRDTYINGAKTGKEAWSNREDKIIKWDFNFSGNFVVMISVKTEKGYRELIYTSGEENGNLYFGLGKYIIFDTWQTITRDLEKDLHQYEPNNKIVSVNAFIIRGSGRIGTIEMLASLKENKKDVKIEPKVESEVKVDVIVKKVEDKIKDIIRKEERKRAKEKEEIRERASVRDENSFTPKITLEEGDTIYHKLGEPFIDPGATARDYDGVSVDVDVIGEVNINKVNRYVLTYIATDDSGYTSTKARVVMVYKAGQEAKAVKKTIAKEPKPSVKPPKESGLNYEEFLDLAPLHNDDLDEDLLYYD